MKELTVEAERSHLQQGLIYVDVSFAFDSICTSNKIHAKEYYAVGKNPFDAYHFVPIVQLKLASQRVVLCLHAYSYFFTNIHCCDKNSNSGIVGGLRCSYDVESDKNFFKVPI